MDRGSLGLRGSHMTSTPFRLGVFSNCVEALLNAWGKIVADIRQLVSIGDKAKVEKSRKFNGLIRSRFV